MSSQLSAHEWLIISLLVTALLLLSFVTLVWNKQELPPLAAQHELSTETVQVTVEGAVKKPGTYDLKKGSQLKELWTYCQPLPDADLRRLKPSRLLRDGQVIKVPLKDYITVHVEGAVAEKKSLRVVKGTLVKELIPLMEFLSEADSDKLNRVRCLKDQEIICVPVKKKVNKRKNKS